MGYTNSPLVSYTRLSPNHSGQRNHAIDTITIHCVVGQTSVESLGSVFAPTSRQASSNYGVGYDGRIGMYVEEKNRSWCTSSSVNDHRAITIEVASDTTHPYAVRAAAYEGLLDLVTDICKRNGIKKLVWSTSKSDRVNHKNGCNMTVHRDYANKSCPGDYLYERHDEIAAEVNKRLGAISTGTTSSSTAVKENDVVKINSDSATYYDGVKAVPAWVRKKNWIVKECVGDRAVIDKSEDGQNSISSAINTKYLTVVKSANSSTTSPSAGTQTVKSYNVVTDLPKYSTSDDAKAKKNSKGTFAPGTYYIYSKYPDGYNGMYNISTDKTGKEAGSWINPAENVKKEETTTTPPATSTETEEKKLYRVRKSKDDAKSQVGAYSSLDNAKDACDKAGKGYKVFDWDYKVVYEYTAPAVTQPDPTPTEPPKQEEPTPVTPTAVYDLNYPEKNLIVDKSIKRTNRDCVKAIKKILSNNSGFNIEIAKAFFRLAVKYGIDPLMAISQSILETGWFKFAGSSVKPEQNNYCGLGATGGGVSGASFNTIEDGVTAQLQHLFAYGSKEALNETIVDPRFKYVTRGIALYWQQLAGRWAVPGYDKNTYDTPEKAMAAGNTYGQKIRTIYNQLLAVEVTDTDLEKYFPTEKPDQEVEKPSTEGDDVGSKDNKPEADTGEKPTEPIPPVDSNDDDSSNATETEEEKTNNIVKIIVNVLKKLFEVLADIFRKGT